MKLPASLAMYARQVAVTLPTIEPRTKRTEVVQQMMDVAWHYGLRGGLMVGLPGGAILTLIVMWVFLWA